ncbi:hypothetical protein V5799_007675, partial [Amblyomma americanum]
MVSLNLDLLNLNTVPLVDPVDMTVRLAIDIGVAPVFDFWFFDDTFIEGKRAVQFRLSGFQQGWHKKRYELKEESPSKITEYCSDQLRLYPGYDAVKDSKFATLITNYDEALVTIINKHVKRNTMFVIRMIEHMGEQTAPKVMPEQWAHPVAKYTKGMYRGIDMIHFQKELLNALKELLEDSDWGEHGFRTILAWRLFNALSEYVQPAKLVGGKDKQEVCYYHVHEVMQFAMASHYLRPRVSLNTVRRVEDMFSNVRGAFRAALKNSSWLNGTVLEFAHRNLNRIKVRVGSLGRTLDESFVNGHYGQWFTANVLNLACSLSLSANLAKLNSKINGRKYSLRSLAISFGKLSVLKVPREGPCILPTQHAMASSVLRAPQIGAIALTAAAVGGAAAATAYLLLKHRAASRNSFVPVGRLANIFIYPIKSVAGIEVPYADCTVAGPVYKELKDRFLLIVKGDYFVSMREEPRLGLIQMTFDDGKLTLLAEGYPPLVIDASDPDERNKPSFTV